MTKKALPVFDGLSKKSSSGEKKILPLLSPNSKINENRSSLLRHSSKTCENHANQECLKQFTKYLTGQAKRPKLKEIKLLVEPTCRLCVQERAEKLIVPCRCPGEFSHCHPSCISHWVEVTRSSICDLCGAEFKLRVTVKTLIDWYFENDEEALDALLIFFVVLMVVFVLMLAGIVLQISQGRSHRLLHNIFKIATWTWWILLIAFVILSLVHKVNRFLDWQSKNLSVQVFPFRTLHQNMSS